MDQPLTRTGPELILASDVDAPREPKGPPIFKKPSRPFLM
jgi:hypothetical protein